MVSILDNCHILIPISLDFFPRFASFSLVIGLYGSVIGINLQAIQKRKWLVILIVTVAVPIQIIATGSLMYLINPAAVSFLLAVAIDQIDPLSVETLLQDKDKMSEEAKGILRIWASFDDPMTVLFGFLILLPLVAGTSIGFTLQTYTLGLALNVIPAIILWILKRYTKIFENQKILLIVILFMLLYAFWTQSYLLAAIAGLFLRPTSLKVLKVFEMFILYLFYIIIFIVGMTLYSYGIDFRLGILLAIVEFFVVQPISAVVFFSGTASDVFRIAFAQQNGLTTLLMGIAFQSLGINVLGMTLTPFTSNDLSTRASVKTDCISKYFFNSPIN